MTNVRDTAADTAGDTAIVVLCHEVDDRIRRWHVHTPPAGLPSHISLLFPFRRLEDLDELDLARLRDVFADEPIEPISFGGTGRFPRVLYLEPTDEARFRRLTELITDAFPDVQPYGGAFDEVIPHLTVTYGAPEAELDTIEAELVPHLPFSTIANEAWLMAFDGDEWSCELRIPFRGAR